MVDEALGSGMCSSCARLIQETEAAKKEQALTLKMIKEKIMSTDKLIKRYQQKCEDFVKQSKEVVELRSKLEASQSNGEILQAQLDESIHSTEPLNKNLRRLRQEKFIAEAKIEELTEENAKQVCLNDELYHTLGVRDEKECSLLLEQQVQAQEFEKQKKRLEKSQNDLKKAKEDTKKEKGLTKQKNRELGVAVRKTNKIELDLQNLKDERKHLTKELKQRTSSLTLPPPEGDLPFRKARHRNIRKRNIPLAYTSLPTQSADNSYSSVEDDGNSVSSILEEFTLLAECPALSPLPPSPAGYCKGGDTESSSSNSDSGSGSESSGGEDSDSDSSIGDLGELLEVQIEETRNMDNGHDVDTSKIDYSKEDNINNDQEGKRKGDITVPDASKIDYSKDDNIYNDQEGKRKGDVTVPDGKDKSESISSPCKILYDNHREANENVSEELVSPIPEQSFDIVSVACAEGEIDEGEVCNSVSVLESNLEQNSNSDGNNYPSTTTNVNNRTCSRLLSMDAQEQYQEKSDLTNNDNGDMAEYLDMPLGSDEQESMDLSSFSETSHLNIDDKDRAESRGKKRLNLNSQTKARKSRKKTKQCDNKKIARKKEQVILRDAASLEKDVENEKDIDDETCHVSSTLEKEDEITRCSELESREEISSVSVSSPSKEQCGKSLATPAKNNKEYDVSIKNGNLPMNDAFSDAVSIVSLSGDDIEAELDDVSLRKDYVRGDKRNRMDLERTFPLPKKETLQRRRGGKIIPCTAAPVRITRSRSRQIQLSESSDDLDHKDDTKNTPTWTGTQKSGGDSSCEISELLALKELGLPRSGFSQKYETKSPCEVTEYHDDAKSPEEQSMETSKHDKENSHEISEVLNDKDLNELCTDFTKYDGNSCESTRLPDVKDLGKTKTGSCKRVSGKHSSVTTKRSRKTKKLQETNANRSNNVDKDIVREVTEELTAEPSGKTEKKFSKQVRDSFCELEEYLDTNDSDETRVESSKQDEDISGKITEGLDAKEPGETITESSMHGIHWEIKNDGIVAAMHDGKGVSSSVDGCSTNKDTIVAEAKLDVDDLEKEDKTVCNSDVQVADKVDETVGRIEPSMHGIPWEMKNDGIVAAMQNGKSVSSSVDGCSTNKDTIVAEAKLEVDDLENEDKIVCNSDVQVADKVDETVGRIEPSMHGIPWEMKNDGIVAAMQNGKSVSSSVDGCSTNKDTIVSEAKLEVDDLDNEDKIVCNSDVQVADKVDETVGRIEPCKNLENSKQKPIPCLRKNVDTDVSVNDKHCVDECLPHAKYTLVEGTKVQELDKKQFSNEDVVEDKKLTAELAEERLSSQHPVQCEAKNTLDSNLKENNRGLENELADTEKTDGTLLTYTDPSSSGTCSRTSLPEVVEDSDHVPRQGQINLAQESTLNEHQLPEITVSDSWTKEPNNNEFQCEIDVLDPSFSLSIIESTDDVSFGNDVKVEEQESIGLLGTYVETCLEDSRTSLTLHPDISSCSHTESVFSVSSTPEPTSLSVLPENYPSISVILDEHQLIFPDPLSRLSPLPPSPTPSCSSSPPLTPLSPLPPSTTRSCPSSSYMLSLSQKPSSSSSGLEKTSKLKRDSKKLNSKDVDSLISTKKKCRIELEGEQGDDLVEHRGTAVSSITLQRGDAADGSQMVIEGEQLLSPKKRKKLPKSYYKNLPVRPGFMSEIHYACKILKRIFLDDVKMDNVVYRLSNVRSMTNGMPLAAAIVQLEDTENFMPQILQKYSERDRNVGDKQDTKLLTPLISGYEDRVLEMIRILSEYSHMKNLPNNVIGHLSTSILTLCAGATGREVDKRLLASQCRLITSLCHKIDDLSRMRVLCYDILRTLYATPGTATYLMISIAVVWPSVLSSSTPSWLIAQGSVRLSGPPHHPLSLTLQMVLITWVRDNGWVLLGNILEWACSWVAVPPAKLQLQQVVYELIKLVKDATFACLENDKDGHPVLGVGVYETIKSLELIACVLGWEWINNVLIREIIWDILLTWVAQGHPPQQARECSENTSQCIAQGNSEIVLCEATVVAAIRLLGLVCRHTIQQCQPAIPQVTTMLMGLLNKSAQPRVTYAIQLAAAFSLLEVSPWQPDEVAQVLEVWTGLQEDQRTLPGPCTEELNRLRLSLKT